MLARENEFRIFLVTNWVFIEVLFLSPSSIPGSTVKEPSYVYVVMAFYDVCLPDWIASGLNIKNRRKKKNKKCCRRAEERSKDQKRSLRNRGCVRAGTRGWNGQLSSHECRHFPLALFRQSCPPGERTDRQKETGLRTRTNGMHVRHKSIPPRMSSGHLSRVC